jgi:hypothetical protein
MNIVGKIEKKGFGTGTWAILTGNGQVYELKGITPELQKVGIKVEIEGRIRDDVMTLAMIGPVFEIESYRILN